jgi:hypothetical protein
MNYCSRTTIQSTTCEGVSFVIHKMNEKRRVDREMQVATIRTRLIETQKTLKALIDEAMPAEQLLTSTELDIEKAIPSDDSGIGARTLAASLKAERQKNKELRDAAPASPLGEIDKTNAEFDNILHSEWYPAWIKWGLYSIEGLSIDDAPATVDTLIDSGPPELVTEIFQAIQKASGLSAATGEALPLPGTSAGPGDGKTSSSTATSAEPPTGTNKETGVIAISISPNS